MNIQDILLLTPYTNKYHRGEKQTEILYDGDVIAKIEKGSDPFTIQEIVRLLNVAYREGYLKGQHEHD